MNKQEINDLLDYCYEVLDEVYEVVDDELKERVKRVLDMLSESVVK